MHHHTHPHHTHSLPLQGTDTPDTSGVIGLPDHHHPPKVLYQVVGEQKAAVDTAGFFGADKAYVLPGAGGAAGVMGGGGEEEGGGGGAESIVKQGMGMQADEDNANANAAAMEDEQRKRKRKADKEKSDKKKKKDDFKF